MRGEIWVVENMPSIVESPSITLGIEWLTPSCTATSTEPLALYHNMLKRKYCENLNSIVGKHQGY